MGHMMNPCQLPGLRAASHRGDQAGRRSETGRARQGEPRPSQSVLVQTPKGPHLIHAALSSCGLGQRPWTEGHLGHPRCGDTRSEFTVQTGSFSLPDPAFLSTSSRPAGHPRRLLGDGLQLPTTASSLPRASASANRSGELGTAQIPGRRPQGQLSGP